MTAKPSTDTAKLERAIIYVRITGIEIPGADGSLFVTTTAGARDPDSGTITFDARVGDLVRFDAASGSNNFDATLLLVAVRHLDGDAVLRRIHCVALERTVIAPAVGTSVLPGEPVEQQFWFFQANVARAGTGRYSLRLTLYERDDEGQPRLVGSTEWPQEFTVQFPTTQQEQSS